MHFLRIFGHCLVFLPVAVSGISCFGGELIDEMDGFTHSYCPERAACYIHMQQKEGENQTIELHIKKGCLEEAIADEFKDAINCTEQISFNESSFAPEELIAGVKCTCETDYCNGPEELISESAEKYFSILVALFSVIFLLLLIHE